jgi:ketosteroid isomerase-like protein
VQELLASGTSGDLGYTVSIEHGTATVTGASEAVPMRLRVTHIYRREAGEWKLVHRHADAVTAKIPAAAVLSPA